MARMGEILAGAAARIAIGGGTLAATGGLALAGQPTPWGIGLQRSVTDVMNDLVWFNSFTLWIVTAITLFVMALLGYCILRFNSKANPVPSKTTHNTAIEVAWTVVPLVILLVIAVPSFRLLYKQVIIPDADMTIKATGFQWYWGYEYLPDENGEDVQLAEGEEAEPADPIAFESIMLQEDELEEGQPRLLAVDNPVVVPVGATVRLQVTAGDVIHSWGVPAFGVKMDGIPGRLNETWFQIEEPGIYYGQCYELCGQNHAYMPIEVHAVEQAQFEEWQEAAQQGIGAASALAAEWRRARNETELAQR